MPFVAEHPSGAPCWFELATTDQAAAKNFYAQLFGWAPADSPMGPGQHYTIFKLDGHDAGAAFTLPPELVAQSVPPHWGVYFATANVDESAAKVSQLGGAVVHPPFDAMDLGRMSVCQDPGGAKFSLWQPKAHKGAGVIGQDNSVCWSELATWDAPQARTFYEALFGWSTKGAASMPTYIEFSVAGCPRGGLLPMDDQWKGAPSCWGVYFQVKDCDAAVAKAKELGAAVRYGPFTAPGVGRMAMLTDPQGASFSLITLQSPAA